MEQRNAVMLIFDLHKKDQTGPISKLPGLWERKLDDQWIFWVNGHRNPLNTPRGTPVSPGDCFVEFNGWPAAIFGMLTGEGTMAAGTAANYSTFCDALERALAEEAVKA